MSIKDDIVRYTKAYEEGNPLISDAEFDALQDKAREMGVEDEVGHGYVPSQRKVTHVNPMLSLSKAYAAADIISFLGRLPKDTIVQVQPKWDGLPVEIVVKDGEIVQASTRGNGIVGESVIQSIKIMAEAHEETFPEGVTYIEVMIEKDDIDKINSEYGLTYKTPRSVAAGVLRSESATHLASRLVYRFHENAGSPEFGSDDVDGVIDAIKYIGERRDPGSDDALPVEVDGAVVKVKDSPIRASMGDNGHYPRWAIAYKFEAEVGETTLVDVVWRTGRTGRIVPVANMEPVVLAKTTVTQATMHNLDIFNSFAPRTGSFVKIKKSGEIIPYIIEVSGGDEEQPFVAPVQCPSCDGETTTRGVDLVCENPDCNLGGSLLHALRTLGIENVGPSRIRSLIDNGLVPDETLVGALFRLLGLRAEDLYDEERGIRIDGIGSVSAGQFQNSVSAAHYAYPWSWVAALGIRGLGRTVSRTVIEFYGGWDGFVTNVRGDHPFEDLVQCDGIGPTRMQTWVDNVAVIRSLIDRMEADGFAPYIEEEPEVTESEFTGKVIVVTGKIEGWTRNEVSEWFAGHGATIGGGVNSKTDLLVAGEKAGSKLAKAESLGVPVMSAEEFLQRVKP